MVFSAYKEVEKKVIEACRKAGRDPKEVMLLPVSKHKPVEDIKELYDNGIRTFGENYVQELTEKIGVLPDDIKWHMIGHLQTNKVKYLIGKTALIHSVDSYRLAEEINKRSEKEGAVTDILAEINIAGEDNKFGLAPGELADFAYAVSSMKSIRLKGLMTSAPIVSDAEENRIYFNNMRSLSVDINNKNIDNVVMSELSMGMTNDYTVAIEEGATIVRVGTAIFGNRVY